ncbi:MAG: methylenetetrahydrofolate reductase [Candidatus Omnitrophota bacterium]|nr:methylenetetrahydrofolate reductase [Candidatus Omnitrophota bacterium]
MGRISLELVPRSRESFSEELELVRKKFTRVDTMNIPDILKYDVRIPEACEVAVSYFSRVIPHIRAVSINKEKPFSYKKFFVKNRIKEILVILGDNPEIVSKSENPCTSVELIRKIKKEMPGLKVYAGIDQWRTSYGEEMEYAREKIDAGADGFFTQPFYELAMIEKWEKNLRDTEVFWGLAPVIRPSSKRYWETQNSIVFPDDFECTMDWNKEFARNVLQMVSADNFHVYFCPITVDFVDYLTGVLT